MNRPLIRLGAAAVTALCLLPLSACGSGDESTTGSANASPSTSATSGSADAGSGAGTAITNTWTASTLKASALPLGDDSSSTTDPGVGVLYTCQEGNPNAGGAIADVPWIDYSTKTWDSTDKLTVTGENTWPSAVYTEDVQGSDRVITTNGEPVATVTGDFPITDEDPAFDYDRNPGSIMEDLRTYTLPAAPSVNDQPNCLGFDAVAILKNGVLMFSGVDGRGDDAVAHEVQDVCGGHPAMTTYHYHSIPPCLLDKATGASTVVGYAIDGFPIVVERYAAGNLPTNADLDECHGRTSPILLDGELVTSYHYSATQEFPYTIGCFRGTPVS